MNYHSAILAIAYNKIEELRKLKHEGLDVSEYHHQELFFLYIKSVEMFKLIESCGANIDLHGQFSDCDTYLDYLKNYLRRLYGEWKHELTELIEYIEWRMKPIKSAKLRF
jgi:hypothetical protein